MITRLNYSQLLERFENHSLFQPFLDYIDKNFIQSQNQRLTTTDLELLRQVKALQDNPDFLNEIDADTFKTLLHWGRNQNSNSITNYHKTLIKMENNILVNIYHLKTTLISDLFPTLKDFEKNFNNFAKTIHQEDQPQDFLALVISLFKVVSTNPIKVEIEDLEYVVDDETDEFEKIINQ